MFGKKSHTTKVRNQMNTVLNKRLMIIFTALILNSNQLISMEFNPKKWRLLTCFFSNQSSSDEDVLDIPKEKDLVATIESYDIALNEDEDYNKYLRNEQDTKNFAIALARNKTLKELMLVFTDMNDFEKLVSLIDIVQNHETITSFIIQGRGTKVSVFPELVGSLKALITNNRKITHLELSNIDMSKDDVLTLITDVSNSTVLKTFILNECPLQKSMLIPNSTEEDNL